MKIIKKILILIIILFISNLKAQILDFNNKEIIVVYAKVVFIDSNYLDSTLFVNSENGFNSLLLLNIINSDSLCYKYIVAFYNGKFKIKTNKTYKFTITKRKTILHYIEENINDTIHITNIEGLPKRMPCKHRVLSSPSDYEYSFYVESVSKANKFKLFKK